MNIDVDRKLYKFMSFYSFVDLIQSKSLNFVRPKVWEDPYEGFIFQKLKTIDGKKEIEYLLKKIPDNIAKSIFFDLALKFEKIFYAQSWSLCSESDAMWRIYNYENKTVRIEVLESKIRQIENIEIVDVEYDDEINLEREIEKIGLYKDQTNFMEIYRVKRTAFRHEREVRLIYQNNEAINQISEDKIELFEKALRGTELESVLNDITTKSYPDIFKIDISSIPSFVNSVCLHPQAPDWFDLTIRKYCELNKINYIGKSKLYTPI